MARMRKKKNLIPRTEACADRFFEVPQENKGRWREACGMPSDSPLYVEIGCGKGMFSENMARNNPDVCYVAIEREPSCCLLAMERAKNAGLTNLFFIRGDATLMLDFFGPSEVDRIFINYCDERFEEFFGQIREKHITDIFSFLLEIFIFLKKYARQVIILKKAHKENLIVETFTDYGTYLAKHIDLTIDNSPITNRIIAAFLAGGTANILLLWFELGLDVPPEEMAEIANNIFRSLDNKIVRK